MSYRVSFLLALILAAGCDTQGPAPAPPGRTEQPIVNGTREPQTVTLTEGQKLAIGWLHVAGRPRDFFCTGTLIAPNVVATAAHCTYGSDAGDFGFGVGLVPSSPVATFALAEIHEHRSVDASLLVLDEDATARVEGLTPIAFNRVALSSSDVGTAVDAAGYGDTYDPSRDGRWFAKVFIYDVSSDEVTVDGRGDQGICYGDSGGPILWEGADGDPVVLAVESWGDESCVDIDHMTRLDRLADWIDPVIGGTTPTDPCEGLDFLGRCAGDIAEWCEGDVFRQRDCAVLGTSCVYLDDTYGYVCDCGDDLDYYGRCDGAVAEYCDEGRFVQVNCEAQGLECGWVSDEYGYYCTDSPTCSPSDRAGHCDGTTLVTCESDQPVRVDCADEDAACAESGGIAECVPRSGGDVAPDTAEPPDLGPDLADDIGPSDPNVDAGAETGGGGGSSDVGCGCAAAQGSRPAAWVLLLGLVALTGRRRRR